MFGTTRGGAAPVCEVERVLPISDAEKCLCFWWRKDLLATKSVEDNIQKARKAFFNFGNIWVFQSSLNPLSSVSVIETCVMPMLLYGSKNWILTPELLKKLESYLAKRVLCWPKHHSNRAATMVVGLQSMQNSALAIPFILPKGAIQSEPVSRG